MSQVMTSDDVMMMIEVMISQAMVSPSRKGYTVHGMKN
jgi:hypothetical protein